MNNQHPITPPPDELVQQWYNECPEANEASLSYVATQAANWGADMELEACRLWVSENHSIYDARDLRLARRPKPPSLKEQALKALDDISIASFEQYAANIIRQALEALPECDFSSTSKPTAYHAKV